MFAIAILRVFITVKILGLACRELVTELAMPLEPHLSFYTDIELGTFDYLKDYSDWYQPQDPAT